MPATASSGHDMAVRVANAAQRFVDYATEAYGFTTDEAKRILLVYQAAKVLKLGANDGQFHIKHGVFLDEEPMRNALAIKDSELPEKWRGQS